jgi:hypothetical protein
LGDALKRASKLMDFNGLRRASASSPYYRSDTLSLNLEQVEQDAIHID